MSDALMPNAEEALAAWARRVRANREQVERSREITDADFYEPVAATFRDDPFRRDDPILDVLRALLRSGDTVLDVGAGAGRYALALALVAREVIALDASPSMLEQLRAAKQAGGIENVVIREGRWPSVEPFPIADVVLLANVGHDIEDIGPFLDAAERAARRACIAVMLDRPPTHAVDALWPEIHGGERVSLPALPEFVTLLLARGHLPDILMISGRPAGPVDPDAVLARARRLLWLKADGPKDQRLRQVLRERLDGTVGNASSGAAPRVGIVSWMCAAQGTGRIDDEGTRDIGSRPL